MPVQAIKGLEVLMIDHMCVYKSLSMHCERTIATTRLDKRTSCVCRSLDEGKLTHGCSQRCTAHGRLTAVCPLAVPDV